VILLRSALGFNMLATLYPIPSTLEPLPDTPTNVTVIVILFKFHKSTIKTICRIQNMSKVIHYAKYINVWNQAEIGSEPST
jgi:hypothetical protein